MYESGVSSVPFILRFLAIFIRIDSFRLPWRVLPEDYASKLCLKQAAMKLGLNVRDGQQSHMHRSETSGRQALSTSADSPPKKLHPNVSLPKKKKPTKKNTEIPLETRKSSSFQFGISRRGNGGSTSGNASGQSSNENSCYLRLTAYEKMLALKWIERVAYI